MSQHEGQVLRRVADCVRVPCVKWHQSSNGVWDVRANGEVVMRRECIRAVCLGRNDIPPTILGDSGGHGSLKDGALHFVIYTDGAVFPLTRETALRLIAWLEPSDLSGGAT